jgi:DNA-binding NarL/FixJ family response regulator
VAEGRAGRTEYPTGKGVSVIADDQALLRSGLRMILATEPDIEVDGEAANGRQVLEIVADTHPDVVVMDVRMPELDGIAATRELTRSGGGPKVLVLTTFDVDDVVYEALCAGASGFLVKDASEERLLAAIRIVADGSSVFAPTATRRVIETFAARRSIPSRGAVADLTDREIDVIKELAKGLSNTEIARNLYVTENTVKTHVARILLKLGLRDRVQAVVWAYQHHIA